jgi:hypothetical protein
MDLAHDAAQVVFNQCCENEASFIRHP